MTLIKLKQNSIFTFFSLFIFCSLFITSCSKESSVSPFTFDYLKTQAKSGNLSEADIENYLAQNKLTVAPSIGSTTMADGNAECDENCYSTVTVNIIPLNDWTENTLIANLQWVTTNGGQDATLVNNNWIGSMGGGGDNLCVGSCVQLNWTAFPGLENECANFVIVIGSICEAGFDFIEVCAEVGILTGFNFQSNLGTIVACEGACGLDISTGNAPFGDSDAPPRCDDCERLDFIRK